MTDLEDYWEAYSMSHQNCPPTADNFERFKAYLLVALKGKSAKYKTNEKKRLSNGGDLLSPCGKATKFDKDFSPTIAGRVSASPQMLYAERKNVGQVVAHINSNLEAAGAGEAGCSKVTTLDYKSFNANVKERYRFMFTTLEERARALDEHLVSMVDDMSGRYTMTEQCPVGVPRTDICTMVGRVCNEAHEGRINKTAVMLEGSRHEAGGTRIHLNVDELKSYSMFPGQVVGVEGLNPSGRKMIAQKICEGVPKPFGESSADDLMKYHHSPNHQDGKPLSIFTACGPFTTTSNLDFDPFVDLLARTRNMQPDVIILIGPFVDANHPQIQNGICELTTEEGEAVTVSFETLFSEKVASLIEQSFEELPELQTQFVLVPSLADAFHENVFPQPPFSDRIKGGGQAVEVPGGDGIVNGSLGLHYIEEVGRGKGGKQRLHCVSNPCTLKINEVIVGVTSTDPLAALNSQECSLDVNRMARMAQHLIQQQSYFPVFPAPDNVNMDLRHIDKFKMPVTPDILLVPSKLAPFAKDVVGSLVINPGSLAKSTTGGTFSKIAVHPLPRDGLEKSAGSCMIAHKVVERTRVEIQKI